MLEQLAGALFWFDPLRGALHRRMLAAREERCDAAALTGCAPAERDLYARTLLDELTRPAPLALAVGLIGIGRSHAMTRISAIVDPKPARRRPVLTLGLCTVLACGGGGAALAASQAGPPSAGEGRIVQRIVVEGNHLLPQSGILSLLRMMHPNIRPGSAVTPADVDLARIGLINTGFFSDVTVRITDDDSIQSGGAELKVAVAENSKLSGRKIFLGLSAAQDNWPIRLAADGLEDTKEAGGMRWVGNVELTGDLKPLFEHGSVMFDGRPAPTNFVPPRKVTADAVELKYAIEADGRRGQLESVNIQGLAHAE